MDAHTHLSDEFNANPGQQRPVAETAIRATAEARRTLLAGRLHDRSRRNALVDGAHTLRPKAAAHAHGAEAAKRAVPAGIDSIEHGTFLARQDAMLKPPIARRRVAGTERQGRVEPAR